MAIRGTSLIKRYNLPLCYRTTTKAVDPDDPFDNGSLETTFTKVVAERCTVQDPNEEDLMLLPEGVRSRKVRRIFTNTFVPSIPEGSDRSPAIFYIPDEFFTINPAFPAEIGGFYEVITSRPRLNGVIEHYDVLAVRVDPTDRADEFPDTTDVDAVITGRASFLTGAWEAVWLT